MLLSLITFIIVLGILVFIHELGHFSVAKWSGMRVDEFALGFPPRLFGIKRGETLYAINAFPLGGYVKLHGENIQAEDTDPRSFHNKPMFQRIAVMIAGVTMNVLLALIVLTIAFSVGFSSISQDLTKVPGAQVVRSQLLAANILPNSAAESSKIQPGDQIIGLGNQAISSAKDLQAATKQRQAQGQLDTELHYTHLGKQITRSVSLAASGTALGVGLVDDQSIRVPFYRAPIVAFKETGAIIAVTWDALRNFGAKLFVHGQLDKNVSGPIGIYQAAASAAHTGFASVVFLLVALSLNLALLNILPIPALDGGRLFFLLIETIFRKRVIAEQVENVINTAGFALIMVLIVILSIRDVIHL